MVLNVQVFNFFYRVLKADEVENKKVWFLQNLFKTIIEKNKKV